MRGVLRLLERGQHSVFCARRAHRQFEPAACAGQDAERDRRGRGPGVRPIGWCHRHAPAVAGRQVMGDCVEAHGHAVAAARLQRRGLLVAVAMGQVEQAAVTSAEAPSGATSQSRTASRAQG